MNSQSLEAILWELIALPHETEWVEFKENSAAPEDIGEYLSALANGASLHGRSAGYLVWGVEDRSHNIVGTTFQPRLERVGNEELEGWLVRLLEPRLDIRFYELMVNSKRVVMLEIPACQYQPVRFKTTDWIRVGSTKRKLQEYPEKERRLWQPASGQAFELELAVANLSASEALQLLDYPEYFRLIGRQHPTEGKAILEQLEQEGLVTTGPSGNVGITNIGALLFARRLRDFRRLGRKAVRVLEYSGTDRLRRQREYVEERGYAVGFGPIVDYINNRLPQTEVITTRRQEKRMYPVEAIRELVANALIHQDLTVSGQSPMIEIFQNRIEFSNPGEPLVDHLRFLDAPPRSRNEAIAALMRRLGFCEEGGTGIDKVVQSIELLQLPAPNFTVSAGWTKIILFAHKPLSAMSVDEKNWACYLHASLEWVAQRPMTNSSLRQRFGLPDENYPMVSRIIRDTIKSRLVKPFDPNSTSKKQARYLPFWA
ncbi:MAG: transcriptional regulator [Chlorobi bacterium CHB2]|nr:transcriptional regulator [Chlorobi bacterium CHB2]